MKCLYINILLNIIFFIFLKTCLAQDYFPQQPVDAVDPTSWRYFRIDAKAEDDSLFSKIQYQLNINPPLESFSIIVNLTDPHNAYVVIGDENDPGSIFFQWNTLSRDVQEGLVHWRGMNKMNLERFGYNYLSPLLEPLKKIRISEVIAPVKTKIESKSTLNYINPYLQLFGGEKFGYPFKESFGFNFEIGTKYSGPLESDQISAGLNYLGLSVDYITRLKGLNTHKINPKTNRDVGLWQQYNNIFSPSDAVELTYILPIGNFLKIGYVHTLGDYSETGPAEYTLYQNSDSSKPMPNYYVKGDYLNFEFKYLFRMLRSTRTEFYFANYLGEYNLGLISREMMAGSCVFDLRTNFTFTNKRNFQFLFEYLFSNITESFGLSSFAIGPSFRFTKLDNGKFGLHTFFINARFQIKHNTAGL